jgi:phosphoserine phosphatase
MRHLDGLSREDLESLLAVTRGLATPFELKTMLGAVTDAACRVLDAERASVWLYDPPAGDFVLEVSRDLEAVRLPFGAGLVGACARSRQPILVPDCYADPRFDPAVDRRSGYHTRCALTLPLVDHLGAMVGVMQVLNRRDGAFAPDDLPLAEALAAQCALALSRVRMTAATIEGERLRRELELARTVQQASLPSTMPDVPGYELDARFLPADLTGGDTYDVAPTEGGVLLVIGDAAGHGLAPALMVTQMQAMLRMALRLGADLETACGQVNDQLAETYTDGRFVTAFVGLLDPKADVLRYVNAGQAPILHWQASTRRCAPVRSTRFPLGAMPDARPPVTGTLTLEPGDLLVLLTDGVVEARARDGGIFGVARVEGALGVHAVAPTPSRLSAASACDAILDALHAFTGAAAQEDDITMLVLKRTPGS